MMCDCNNSGLLIIGIAIGMFVAVLLRWLITDNNYDL